MPPVEPPQHEQAPSSRIDPNVVSLARAYDAMLDGKDNYAVDRALVDELKRIEPAIYPVTRNNRDFLIRACRFMASEAKIGQFIDVGSGLPTAENTHQAVQRINREATVIYSDWDPIVNAHGRALLEENDRTFFVEHDLTHAEELFSHPTITRHIDFDRPIGLLQVGTLHHMSDAEDPWGLMKRYIDLLPSGSYVAITHFYNPHEDDEVSEAATQLETFLLQDLKTGRFRTREEIVRLFDGLELVEPGVVPVSDWWPDGPRLNPDNPTRQLILGGVALRP